MVTTTTGIATEFIQFSRTSNATVTDSDGFVKWAPHNLLLNSESFDAAAWGKTSVTPTANSIAAPNGTTTADTLAASGANGTTLQTFTAEAISYTFAVWLKRKTGTGNIQIAADSGTYTTVTITSDWALYTVTQTPAAGSKSAGIRIVTSADEVYAWGAALYRSDLAMQPNTSAYPFYNPTTPKNLLGFTESLTTNWTNSNTTDAIVSEINPVGLTGAVDVAATAGNGTLLSSLSLLASPYTFSIWLKRKTGSGTVEITVDGTTYVAAAVTGTWTRFSTTLTPSAGTKTPGIRLVTSGDAVYAWGAQLSNSASLDSYVPVYGTAVTSAAYYGPRRDFDGATLACNGLLVEEQRTNIVLNSAAFDAASWNKTNLNTTGTPAWINAESAPDGTVTAEKLIANTVADRHMVTSADIAAGTYTWSVFMKAGGRTRGFISAYTVADGYIVATLFNLSGAGSIVSQVAGSNSTITALSNSWYRCTVTQTLTAGTTFGGMQIGPNLGGGVVEATAGNDVDGIYVWGAQLEAGSFATSYIPTGSASATRNADVASVSTQAFPYSATEGTIVANVMFANYVSGDGRIGGVVGFGSSAPRIILAMGSSSNRPFWTQMYDGTNAINLSKPNSSDLSVNTPHKVGTAYTTASSGVSAFTWDGISAASSTNPNAFNLSGMATMQIGNQPDTATYFNGHIRQITYLPRRVTDAELQTRTS